MKPAPFEYHAPESISDVVALLAEHGDEAKVLAGGQSLVPMLALRLTRFEHIVDLNRVDELRGVSRVERHAHRQGDDHPARGRARRAPPVTRCRCSPRPSRSSGTSRSATGGRSAARSRTPTPRRSCRRSRSRSTPSSRSPARAATARFRRPSSSSARGPRPSASPTRSSTAVHFPVWSGRTGFAVEEVARRSGDFALAGVVAAVEVDDAGSVARSASRSSAWHPRPCAPREAEAGADRHRPHDGRARRDRPARSDRHRPHRRRRTRRPSTASTSAPISWCAPSTERWEPRVAEHAIQLTVNGEPHSGSSEARKTLADYLREDCGLTGTHLGCEHGVCGACTVLRRRCGRAVVPDVRGAGRRRRRHHDRGHRPGRRLAGSGAGGVPPGARSAVRVLHPGLRRRACTRSSRTTPTPPSTRSAKDSPATSAAAPATRGSSRPCRSRRRR